MDASLLFAGLRFDKRRFAADFAKFQKKSEDAEIVKETETLEADTKDQSKKKRKRKFFQKTEEGFNLFKAPESQPTSCGQAGFKADVVKKEHFRRQEMAVALRKKYGLYVAGEDVPPPLQDFEELKSIYGCKSYLMRNLAQLGFREPTPIQRQAIPALLLVLARHWPFFFPFL